MAFPARGEKSATLHPLKPALDKNKAHLSPTQPRLNNGANGCQGIRDNKPGTPNPEAIAKPSKPTVHWVDDDRCIIQKEGRPGSHQQPPPGSLQKECSSSCNLKRRWESLGDLACESRSPPLEAHSKKLKSNSTSGFDCKWWMTCCIRDVKETAKLVNDVFKRIEELDKLFTRPGNFTNLSKEEQKIIDACLGGSDLLLEAGDILYTLKNGMQNEGGEDSDEDGEEFEMDNGEEEVGAA